MNYLTLKIADERVRIGVRYADYLSKFEEFAVPEEPGDDDVRTVVIGEEYLSDAAVYYPGAPESFVEYNEMQFVLSSALLNSGVIGMHGVAMLWKGRAWIFTAKSGTGKTTQYRNWKKLWPDETDIINGDKVFLRISGSEDGKKSITAYSCPWKGKEGYGSNISAPLGGIIWLKQAKENRISVPTDGEAAVKLIRQLLFLGNCPEEIKTVAELDEAIVRNTEIIMLENLGDAESACLTREYLEKTAEESK
ncbi:MAG: hypothetical protein MJ137_08425 [Clostridia bacterium]|nr:hypothetical protein [Clostridia bacterium]